MKGINAATQAKARGTFEEDKKRLMAEENMYESNRQKEKRAESERAAKKTQRRKGTKVNSAANDKK